jgi:transcription initiation factor TFIIIB Brf1 subunit/transcription initiation factor TFIIB
MILAKSFQQAAQTKSPTSKQTGLLKVDAFNNVALDTGYPVYSDDDISSVEQTDYDASSELDFGESDEDNHGDLSADIFDIFDTQPTQAHLSKIAKDFSNELETHIKNQTYMNQLNEQKEKKRIKNKKKKTERVISYYNKQDKNIGNFAFCKKCKSQCLIAITSVICKKCGQERDRNFTVEHFGASDGHNTSRTAFAPFKFTGKGATAYQHVLLVSGSDYSIRSKIIISKELHRFNRNFETQIPKDIVNKAVKMFNNMRDNIKNSNTGSGIVRNDVKNGVLGACLSYACAEANYAMPFKKIAELMEIEETYLHQGDRRVRAAATKKHISLPKNINVVENYVDKYCRKLGVDEKYIIFVKDLINRVEEKKLNLEYACQPLTKCAGAIYMLTRRVKSIKITEKQISSNCGISRGTFKRYYDLIVRYHRLFKKVFKRNGISMDKEWKL